ncbi:DUF1697 domain-containing protein [Carboxylicivirga marina]|uniref:DUF1697 domain-containing protein n=1 Tax=Carboxylicivirga marina TaxID=2800988 RepID=UPI0025997FF5|nr:DUF1697 domain-containing protein [uncultured Carboxylicivirga sp.]
MSQYISILRGINVGGKRKILMKDLKQSLEKIGLTDVRTYIQSGNIVFKSVNYNTNQLEVLLCNAIKKTFGHDVPVIVLSDKEWRKMIECNPFIKEDINHLHITLLQSVPEKKSIEQLMQVTAIQEDKIEVIGKSVYMLIKRAYHHTKLTNRVFERCLKTKASTRNWKTALKINELLDK